MEPAAQNIQETATARSWRWRLATGDLEATVRQLPSLESQANSLDLCWNDPLIERVELAWGVTQELGNVAEATQTGERWEVSAANLTPRGQRHFAQLTVWPTRGEPRKSQLLSFCTLVRYPYGYRYSQNDPQMRHRPETPRLIKGRTEDQADAQPILELLGSTDPRCYHEHIVQTVTRPGMTEMEKVVALWKFLGTAVAHHAIYQPPVGDAIKKAEEDYWHGDYDLEALVALELHMGRCGYINTYIGKALFRCAGLELVSYPPPGCHCAAKIKIDEKWYFVDLDGWKAGNIPVDESGQIPELDWLVQSPHFYLLDCYPSWQEIGGDWVLTADGARCTGNMCTAGSGQMGYASCFYGAPTAYPPSVPIALPVRVTEDKRPVLEWIGSYDPDDDFHDYVLELGSKPGANDLGVIRTTNTFHIFEHPPSGAVNWRVRATDRHAANTPYADRIFYSASNEQTVDTIDAEATQRYGGPHLPDKIAYEQPYFALDLSAGDLGGFERVEGWDDYYGNGSAFRTDLVNLSYGRDGRALHLDDWSNKWLSGSAVRSLWHNQQRDPPKIGAPFGLDIVLWCDRCDVGGSHRFPTIAITHSHDQSAGLGLLLDPSQLLVIPAHKTWGQWWAATEETRSSKGSSNIPLDAGWHQYRFLFEPSQRRLTVQCDQRELLQSVLPAAEGWLRFRPDLLCIASNPEAEALWYLAGLAVFRL